MDKENTSNLLLLAEQVINQTHYAKLSELKVLELDDNSRSINAEDVLCLFRITELVYDDGDSKTDKFSIVFNALHSCGASCIMILEFFEGRTELYLGAINKQRYENINYLNVIRDILKTSIQGNLPGSEIKEVVSKTAIKKILGNALDNGFDSQCITSVSCVPDSDLPMEHGLEALLGAAREKNFSIIIIADPVSDEHVETVKNGYEDLGTNLSALESASITIQNGSNYTTSENSSVSFNESINRGISLTQSHNVSGTYKKERTEKDKRNDTVKTVTKLGAGAAALIGSGGNIGASYLAMNAAEQLMKGFGGKSAKEETALTIKEENFNLAKPLQNSDIANSGMNSQYASSPETITSANSEQEAINLSKGQAKTEQAGKGKSFTQVESASIQKTTRDFHISGLNEKLVRYLKWLNKSKNYGMFNCCTYIVSGSASTNLFVAGQYQALIQSYGDTEQPITINTWTRENGVEKIRESLLHLIHPTFEANYSDNAFSGAMLMSSNELSRQMSFPKKSVLGVSVTNHASFGIEVVRKKPLENGSLIRVGEINHMGKNTLQPVLLSLQSLASNAFIAGTNGSGKSNTVFKIIEELERNNIPYMVIEPAKGEYKNLFGHDPEVTVYGTNPKKSELLIINPFWFNDKITVREHIDNLISIFNASWSMTAAMPNVLKESIENAYKICGWNIKKSECLGKKRYPTVRNVLNEFNKKMKSTDFSDEVKGNYVGALSTRMESLCNGIYEDIFSGEDTGDEALFDRNVIIDLSRVGSAETKSLIMGFLIIRLQEYRMRKEALNLPLQHVTVLEEAHHLLRRTSSVQTNEGTNMVGKSVEMISNMISEMRSYGEGFLIVDQSPGLLDMSVIRNTNTKIVMRLFENSDRELVGNAMELNQKQKAELARLKTGVCAIYQDGWLEPVLCSVDKAEHEAKIYRYSPSKDSERLKSARGTAFDVLLSREESGYSESEIISATTELKASDYFDNLVSVLLTGRLTEKKYTYKDCVKACGPILWKLIDGDGICDYIFTLITSDNIYEFDAAMREQICKHIVCSDKLLTSLINILLSQKSEVDKVKNFHCKWAWKFMLNKKTDM